MNRILIAVFTCLTMIFTFMGMSNLLVAGPWQGHMIFMPVLFTLVIWGVMALWSSRVPRLAILASAVAAVIVWIMYLCRVAGDGIWSVIPTPTALNAVGEALNKGMLAVFEYGRPAPHPELFIELTILGLGPMCILAVFLALAAHRPVWVGIPAVICWTIFIGGSPDVGMGWLLASGVAYLLLISVSPRKDKTPQRVRAMSVPVLALATVLGLFGAFVAPSTPGWGHALDWFDNWNGPFHDTTGITVSGSIDVSDRLHSQSSTIVFYTYGEPSGPLRVSSLTSFLGEEWAPDPGDRSELKKGEMVWEDFAWQHQRALRQSTLDPPWSMAGEVKVEITGLPKGYLLTTLGPRSITSIQNADMFFELGTDSIQTREDLPSSTVYVLQSADLDRRVLEGMRVPWELKGEVPDDLINATDHWEEIRNLTLDVVGSASTQNEMLRAIESYLRGGRFSYTLTPRWSTTGDPVWDFLTERQGYCVHFATAMAVMGRSIGIPIRVSVGFLPGIKSADGWATVRNSDAHMWPEAYYPEVGWVRYEPTPGVISAGQSSSSTSQPTPEPTLPDDPTSNSSDLPANNPTTGPGAGGDETTWLWRTLTGVGVAMIALLVIMGVWVGYVRSYSPERAWTVIQRRGLRAGILTEGMSVRTALSIVGEHCGDELAGSLEELREGIERARYGPPGESPDVEKGRKVHRVTRMVVQELRHRV